MSSELVAILEKNKRESYRILGKFLKNNGRNNLKLRKVLEGHSKWEGRIATFTNVVVSSDIVILPKFCISAKSNVSLSELLFDSVTLYHV
jgi:hypothetical protein